MKAIAKQYKLTQRERVIFLQSNNSFRFTKQTKCICNIFIYLFCKNNIWTEFERKGDEKKADGMGERGRALAAHSDTLTINV